MKYRSVFGLVLAACLMAAPAAAQLSSDGGPIYVASDKTESFELDRKVVLTGNVDIQQGTARLRADRVEIQFAARTGAAPGTTASGFGQVQSMVANGEVFYVTPELKAKGKQAVYDLAADTITMTGDVAVLRNQDVAEGQKLVMQVKKRVTTLDGGTSRAGMVIYPNGTSTTTPPNR